MSFREKSAWISLISIVLITVVFLLHEPLHSLRPEPSLFHVHVLLLCISALIGIVVVSHIVISISSPKDARTPKDERERLIDLKAVRIAHYVFIAGASLSVLAVHHGANAIAVSYGILFAFVLAEVVNFGSRIVFYRRDS